MQVKEPYEHDFYVMRHAKSIYIQAVINLELVSMLKL